MPEANGSNGADATDEQREEYPWVTQQPNSRIVGNPVDLIYAGELGSDVAQNSDSYILVLEDPTVIGGTLVRNKYKPDDGTTADVLAEDATRPTDYRVVSKDSGVGTWVEDMHTTQEEGVTEDGDGMNVYTEAAAFDEDRIAIFYNGMTGNRVGRALDFNGRQYARWTDTPYLVKGLYQPHPDWRGADSQTRADLAGSGHAPRVARVPIPRWKVDGVDYDADAVGDEIVIDMSKMYPDQSNSGYEVHVFEKAAMEADFDEGVNADIDEMNHGRYGLDVDSELDYTTHDDPERVLADAEVGYAMYTAGEWQDEPSGWELEYDFATSFGIAAAVGSEDDGGADEQIDEAAFEEDLHNFASEVASALPDGQSPEDAFDGGLGGLVESRADQFRGRDPTEEDVANIRTEVYSEVNWLDVESLESE